MRSRGSALEDEVYRMRSRGEGHNRTALGYTYVIQSVTQAHMNMI